MNAVLLCVKQRPRDLLSDVTINEVDSTQGRETADFLVEGVPANLDVSWPSKSTSLRIEGNRFDLIPAALELLGLTDDDVVLRNPEWIRLPECVKGNIYFAPARNFTISVFDGDRGFIGVRQKFESEYLFTEYHYDADPLLGTVRPYRVLGELSTDIGPHEESNQDLLSYLKDFIEGADVDAMRAEIFGSG